MHLEKEIFFLSMSLLSLTNIVAARFNFVKDVTGNDELICVGTRIVCCRLSC